MYVLLFDIDGTLLASGGAGKAAMERALTSAFRVPDDTADIPFSGRTDRAIARDLFHLYAIEDNQENWRHFLEAYLLHLPSSLVQHKGRILPGIGAFLKYLQQREDVEVGLLTGNVREGARLKLSHYGLFHHFAFGGYGDQHFHREQVAHDALRSLHEHLNGAVDCDKVWVIGDTPLDVRCARSIGARALAVATGWHSYEILAGESPDLVLTDLADPAPFLAVWDGQGS
jgi:phosphoglycolate phosphatase-like HAD superfamily hydrolase